MAGIRGVTKCYKVFHMVSRTFCQHKEMIPPEQLIKYHIRHLDYSDNMFSKLILTVKSKKARTKSGLILLEGKRLIQDALKAGVQPEMIFFTRRTDLEGVPNLNLNIQIYKLPYKEMQFWSGLTTSPGIVAFCKIPEPIEKSSNCLPITVVCDQVREPGNLGALIRSAAAAGVERVILLKGCVDLWDCKVLRGASGGHFHVSIINDVAIDNFPELISKNTNFLLAVNQPSSIILPCSPYYNLDYKQNNTTLVIGGETEGLSPEVIQLATEMNGQAVHIPLSNHVESLNCVSALSILLFEIKRQILL